MKRFNQVFLNIIHSFYYMLGSVLLFIIICDNIIENSPNISILIPLTLAFNIVLFALIHKYENSKNMDLFNNRKFIYITITASILSGLACGFKQGLLMVVFTSAYFVAISITILRTNRVDTPVYLKLGKSLGLIVVISSFYFNSDTVIAYGNRVIDFVYIYFAVIVFYVICINFNEHYEGNNAINRNKNLFIFNFLIATLITIFTFFRQQLLRLLEILKYYISPAVDSFIEKTVDLVRRFFELVFSDDFVFFMSDKLSQNQKNTGDEQEKIIEEATELVESVSEPLALDFIFNLLLILVIVGIIFLLYKRVTNYNKKTIKKSFEEKEFVFKRDDFLNDLKNSLKKRFRKKESLSRERLIYKKTVNQLLEEGYEIRKSSTPNEFINTINDSDIKKYNFHNITSEYNAYRYGKDNT